MYTIYLIQIRNSEGPVKIGLTAGNPTSRVQDLQVAIPWDVVVIRLIKGHRILERALHQYFADFAMRGEWFRFTAEMLTIDPDVAIRAYHETTPPNLRRRLWTHIPIHTYGEMTAIGDLKHLVRN